MECRKMLSLFLALLLLIACIPVTALAAETDALIEEIEESESAEEVTQENEEEDTIVLIEEPTDEDTEDSGDEHEDCPEAGEDGECEDNFYPTTPSVDDILMELYPDGVPDGLLNLDEVLGNKTRKSGGMMLMSGGSSGSETGGGGGGGSAAGGGGSMMVAAGVTMQVVYYRYDECYNRFNSHANVVDTLHSGMAIPWNASGKDIGERATTVFDNFTISSNTFIVKAMMFTYPYVYRFEPSYISDDDCTFTWPGFNDYWFSYNNPGGRPQTSPYIIRNTENGDFAIEEFITRIILGNAYGEWNKLDVAKGQTYSSDTSLFARTLRYLGASNQAIQNYLDAYFGKLSISQDGDTLIPTIIWAWVGAETLGNNNRIYTIGDVAMYGSSNENWLDTAYTSNESCISGYGSCSWMANTTETMVCKLMMGGNHSYRHYTGIWQNSGSYELFGTGLVNRVQTEVDDTELNGTNSFYFLRGYWTPYGSGEGSITLYKTNEAEDTVLPDAEFVLYRDVACTTPIADADYVSLSTTDTGYVNESSRKTSRNGTAAWTGLHSGTYFMVEAKAPDGYKVNVDTLGNVEVKEITVKPGANMVTVKNAREHIVVPGSIEIIKETAEAVRMSGVSFCLESSAEEPRSLTTDANGVAVFEDLPVFAENGTAIRYRVTELSTLDGYTLTPCAVWLGELSEYAKDSYKITLRVINDPGFELPHTGSSISLLLYVSAVLFAINGVLLIIRRKRVL